MTTREIYFKVVFLSELPCGNLGYVYKDNFGKIQVGKHITLELRTDKKIVDNAIKRMKEIENTEGFMFWNNSPEGEEFFKSIKW